MPITLGGTELNGSVQWEERFQAASVSQASKRTIGGYLVVYNMDLIRGEPVTLTATEDTGWFTKEMVDAIIAMARTTGGQYSLDYHGAAHTVMFRHEDSPVVDFTPIVKRDIPQAGEWFTGTVKLFTV